ncbi:hypothetical protein B0H11DRAFT_1910442 [Mycena galericulata]|nr:hypothetical protein B0H11DRAFT_1910442 [Mycena galericulata]
MLTRSPTRQHPSRSIPDRQASPSPASNQQVSVSKKKTRKKKTAQLEIGHRSDRGQNLHRRNRRKESRVSEILEERRRGKGWQYKVLWDGEDIPCSWLPGTVLKVNGGEALTSWEKQKQLKAKSLTL